MNARCKVSWLFSLILAGLVMWLALCVVNGAEVSEAFVNRVIARESANGRFLYGRGGELGLGQLKRAAWEDVNRSRLRRGLPIWLYRTHALVPATNRLYTREYLSLQATRLERAWRRPPTESEIEWAYRMGTSRYLKQH